MRMIGLMWIALRMAFVLWTGDDLDILQYSYKMIREQDGCVISVRNYECVPFGMERGLSGQTIISCVGEFYSIFNCQNLSITF